MKTVGEHPRIATTVMGVLVALSVGSAALPKRSMVTYYHGGGCESFSSYKLTATQEDDSAAVGIVTSNGRTATFTSRIPIDVYAMVWDSLVEAGFFGSALLTSYQGKVTRTGMHAGYISMEYDSGGASKTKKVTFHADLTSVPEFITAQRLASSFDPWARTAIEQFRHGDLASTITALERTFIRKPDGRLASPQCDYIIANGYLPEVSRAILDYVGRDVNTDSVWVPREMAIFEYFGERSLPEVIEALHNRGPRARALAVEMTAKLLPRKRVRYLLPLLNDRSQFIRNRVAYYLGYSHRKEAAVILMHRFKSESDSLHLSEATVPLLRTGSQEGIDLMIRWAEARSSKTSVGLVSILAQVQDQRMSRLIGRIAEEDIPNNRSWAPALFSAIGYRASDTVLLGWVSSYLSSDTANSALENGAKSLVRLSKWVPTAGALRRLFNIRGRSPSVLQALGDLCDTTFYDSFRFYSADSDANRRTAAVAALARFDDEESRRLRLVALKRSDVTYGIVASFDTQPDPRAHDRLVELLGSPSYLLRLAATGAVGKLGDPSVIPALKTIGSNDENGYVRNSALAAIKRLERKRSPRIFHR